MGAAPYGPATTVPQAMSALRPRPGDVVVGVGEAGQAAAPRRLRTLLGSCVAVTWWHPGLRVGYLAHVASARRREVGSDLERPRSWFAAEAVPRAVRWAAVLDANPAAWTVKVVGGGRQFQAPAGRRTPFDVPAENLAEVRHQLRSASFEPVAWHVGGTGPRILVLDLHDGDAWISHTSLPALGDVEPRLRVGRLSPGYRHRNVPNDREQ